MYVLVCQRGLIEDVGVARRTVFQEVRPGAVFKTGDFVKEKLGGVVERLISIAKRGAVHLKIVLFSCCLFDIAVEPAEGPPADMAVYYHRPARFPSTLLPVQYHYRKRIPLRLPPGIFLR